MQQGVRLRKTTPHDSKEAGVSNTGSRHDGIQPEKRRLRSPSPLPLLLAFHLFLALVSRGFFQPDEYWQSLEVAHRIAYGYGYTTWEWKAQGDTASGLPPSRIWEQLAQGPIRSVIHPAFFVPVYWLLQLTGLEDTSLRTTAPRLLQAVLSALASNELFHLARDLGDEHIACSTLLSLLTSPYYLYTAARTFANTAEASLTVFALRRALNNPDKPGATTTSLAFAAAACLIRPTNAVLWVFVYGCMSCEMIRRSRYAQLASLWGKALVIGLLAIAVSIIIDSTFHGRFSLPMIPFLLTNVYHSLSLFYGSHPWHWYFTQGLPVVGMMALPFAGMGVLQWSRKGATFPQRMVVGTVIWTVAAFSLLGHKEWRFLQPVVPLLHLLAGVGLASSRSNTPLSSSWSASSHIWHSTTPRRRLLLLSTLPLAIYLLLFHCIAQGSIVPSYLRQEHAQGRLQSVGFLMPCHSTPWQSHLHLREMDKDDRMWFVSCDPPRAGEDVEGYMDESDFFYEDPVRWLRIYLPGEASIDSAGSTATRWDRDVHPALWQSPIHAQVPAHHWPSHIALFDALLQHPKYGREVQILLARKGYVERTRLWNSLVHDDERRRGYIVVLRHESVGRGD
ncbi:hypothetical protein BDZ90DRAFT_233922 [Jaminaea rosea]|uniref:Mannosyltransferase n=1 Tax=Jaminaea rosea TaxID=1569628 RepID=A0A316UJR6_9BASI|nr:hypothetical protein BDZ90DRAFT_233922 [Jaminaea rosea]PWN25469.1 hypothetical protein BDZ90DRAFT_233922 [Jaminaea rosea]